MKNATGRSRRIEDKRHRHTLRPFLCLGTVLLFLLNGRPLLSAEPPPSRALPEAQAKDLNESARLSERVHRLYQQGLYDEALPLATRALELSEKAVGPKDPEVATSLVNLAQLYQAKGNYDKAEPLLQRALSIRQATLGSTHAGVAVVLNQLARLQQERGDYEQAEALFQKALSIRERALGPSHPDVATTLNNMAALYQTKGEYQKAEEFYSRALTIKEAALGRDHPSVAASLNNLAELYREQGDYTRAEPLYLRALAIKEKVFGPDHLSVATSLNNLAELYRERGDLSRAEPLYERTLRIRERVLGPDHSDVALAIHNLAELYREQRDHGRAIPLYERALTITESVLGPTHPEVATSLNNLALVYQSNGEYAKAEKLHERALAIQEATLGPTHPEAATSLNNLALLYQAAGDKERAETLYQRALTIFRTALGPTHPSVATTLSNLAELNRERDGLAQAVTYQSASHEIRERNLTLILGTGSESAKQAYMSLLETEMEQTVSLHAQSAPQNPEALRLALTTVLRRKGRVLDAVTDSIGTLRRRMNQEDRTLLDELASARSHLASLVFGAASKSDGSHDLGELAKLEERVRDLEAQVSARSAEFRAQSQSVTIKRVQESLPSDSALLELVTYRPFQPEAEKGRRRDASSWGPRRYVAYLLRREGSPEWADLGDAAPIDQDVTRLREALSDPRRTDFKDLARNLEAKVVGPIRSKLGDAKRLFISPDGALNLVPFGALVDDTRHYLIERYSMTHVTTGRDLIRLRITAASRENGLIVADPDFSGPGAGAATHPVTRRGVSRDFRTAIAASTRFAPLPGTAAEAQALHALLPSAKVLTGLQATKDALKQVHGPRILHIATHGFFLAEEKREDGPPGFLVSTDPARALHRTGFDHPLLRSGLALAGASRSGADNQDGLLTALEVTGLDLWGTKLVVLSACETGVGDVRNGEGVYGLRRALVIAGAEAQVISLWKVTDGATRHLMENYYKRLISGQGRTEALRQAKLDMLGQKNLSHPFFWAAFIPSGEWEPVEGLR